MMKRISFSLLVLALLSGVLLGCGGSEETSRSDELTARAKELVESLAAGDFSTPAMSFDDTMKGVLPPEKLKEAWESLVSQAGPFREQSGTRAEKAGGYDVVYVTCAFERSSFDLKLVFDEDKRVSGLFFVPAGEAAEYEPPAYVNQDSFTEEEVTVGTGEWALPGTLTVPRGDGPFSAVVLVHGSGPMDRDESVGPNKPFRDLAWGLASRGIAVLRYEKRTLEHQAKLVENSSGLTVNEETVDDALDAVTLLGDTERIDAGGIYVLGHSLGGMLIPRIAGLDKTVRGFIIMAGASRPLEDLLLEQMSYIYSLDGTVTGEEQAQLELLEAQVAKVKGPELSESTPPAELPPGLPAAYWLDLRGYDPPDVARGMTRPVLLIQGERDYQVTMADYELWENALESLDNVTMITYPDLNHLFMEGEGKSTPAEYETAGHISEAVINDIAMFVEGG